MGSLDEMMPACWIGRPVEQASFDDFFVRLPDGLDTADAALAWAQSLRAAILEATGLRCSVGLARTKLLSVLATKRAKPDGVHCCSNLHAEYALLDDARISAVRGAGLRGICPSTRTALLRSLGEEATLGEARAWLTRDDSGIAAALEADEAAALAALLDGACDGSVVVSFAPPKGLSVECSVRPTDDEPAVSVEQVGRGFAHLALLLLSRMDEYETTYGTRVALRLVVKWKLFPGATETRQAQADWPRDADADALAALACRTFASATASAPFRVSRVELALVYAAENQPRGHGSTATRRSGSRRAGPVDDPTQPRIDAQAAAWTAAHAPSADSPSVPSRLYTDEDPATTIKGLGFRDAEVARLTIKLASQPGCSYKRYWSIKAMAERARHHAAPTEGMRRALAIFDEWLRAPPPGPPASLIESEHAQRRLLAASCANAHGLSRCADADEFHRRAVEDKHDGLCRVREGAGSQTAFGLPPTSFVAVFGGPEAKWCECHRAALARELVARYGCAVLHIKPSGELECHPQGIHARLQRAASAREALEDEWRRLTTCSLPWLALANGWPLTEDHCFMRIALDAAFSGCWYDHLDKSRPAIRQISTADLGKAVAAVRRIEAEGVSALVELNDASFRWRGKVGRVAS